MKDINKQVNKLTIIRNYSLQQVNNKKGDSRNNT